MPYLQSTNNYRVHVLQRKVPHDATKRINKWRDSAKQSDHSKYRWANADVGGVQTVLCKIRLKNQAGVDHAMIRLLKKCKRQSKMFYIKHPYCENIYRNKWPVSPAPRPKCGLKGKRRKENLYWKWFKWHTDQIQYVRPCLSPDLNKYTIKNIWDKTENLSWIFPEGNYSEFLKIW